MTGATVTKRRADAAPGFFEAEAAGLRWLASAHGARTARVVDVAPGRIELERIVESRPTATAAYEFGRALAVTHAAGAAAFGAAPDGHTGQLFIGSRPMPTAGESNWGRFYARDRVLPFLEIAIEAGTVDAGGEHVVRQACDRIEDGDFESEVGA